MSRTANSTTAPTTNTTKGKTDVYATITARIVEQLEAGVRPWHRPWAVHAAGGVSRPLRHTGQPYQGVNVVVLWLTAFEKGYACPLWLTFNQAKELGGCVRMGEKGTTVVYASTFDKTHTDADTGEETTERVAFLKSYIVFNGEQVKGLPARFTAPPPPAKPVADRLRHADEFFARTGARVDHGGVQAFYAPAADRIQMPPYEAFADREGYYSTLAHESVHWVGHPTRLNRDLGGKRFGDAGYAMEELVAELGAAFLCADLGITPDVREDHAAYLATWLKVLKADSRALFTAAGHAGRAAEYLHGLQPPPPADPTPIVDPAPAPVPPARAVPAADADPTGLFLDMFAAMHDEDYPAARGYAERLRAVTATGNYPTRYTRAEVDAYVAGVLRRTAGG